MRTKNSCNLGGVGLRNEVRIYIGDPTGLTVCGPNTVDCNGYYAQAIYDDFAPTVCKNITIDNYRVDTIPFHNGVNKDYMAKVYYRDSAMSTSSCP